MKIETGISIKKMCEIRISSTPSIPSKYNFKISIDNKKYDACLVCYTVLDKSYSRNNMTGSLECKINHRKTINEISVYKFDNIEAIVELSRQNFFKVDKEDYYLKTTPIETRQNNKFTMIEKLSIPV